MKPHIINSDFCLPWQSPLLPGRLIGRRNRFLLDVTLDSGEEVVAYCANPGTMEGLIVPNARVWLSEKMNPTEKLRWTWELIELKSGLVATNSAVGNRITKALLYSKKLTGLRRYKSIKTEIRINPKTRIDFELCSKDSSHYLEVKGAHLIYPDGNAYFPDSLTVRSERQLKVLMRLRKQGSAVTLLIVVPCVFAKVVRPSDLHDSRLSATIRKAVSAGINVRAILVEPTLRGMIFRKEIPVDLNPYNLEKIKVWKLSNKQNSGWKLK